MEQVYSFIQNRTGLSLNAHQRTDIANLVSRKSKKEATFELNSWLQQLAVAPINAPTWQEIINLVTVSETYFFRNADQFNALRSFILPTLIEKKRASHHKSLRLWCAGCATGEEPYSLAILLRDLLPDYRDWQITLLATDINQSNLDRAKQGVYRPWSFRNETPLEVQERWFKAEKETFRINPTIKKMVTFAQLNLISDEYPALQTAQ